MITTQDMIPKCGCRSVGECSHGIFAQPRAFDAVVNAFNKQMKVKFRKKYLEGRDGWDNRNQKHFIKASLKKHISKGDMVDVANLAAMIWNMEQP